MTTQAQVIAEFKFHIEPLGMAASACLLAKRALVTVILSLGRAYQIIVNINRQSADEQILKAYRRALLKAHPDKGGKKIDMQLRLGAAKASGRPVEKSTAA